MESRAAVSKGKQKNEFDFESRGIFILFLFQILSRYDLVVILEVVDVSGASVRLLLEELNR